MRKFKLAYWTNFFHANLWTTISWSIWAIPFLVCFCFRFWVCLQIRRKRLFFLNVRRCYILSKRVSYYDFRRRKINISWDNSLRKTCKRKMYTLWTCIFMSSFPIILFISIFSIFTFRQILDQVSIWNESLFDVFCIIKVTNWYCKFHVIL